MTSISTYETLNLFSPTSDHDGFTSSDGDPSHYNSNENNVGKGNLKCCRQVLEAHDAALFPFEWFNRIQSLAFDDAFHSDESLILSSPTGSGKTVVAELAILRVFARSSFPVQQDSSPYCVYIAPLKSLCQERYQHWSKLFQPRNLRIHLTTGDTEYETGGFEQADIIIATPERYDFITRKQGTFSSRRQPALIIFDEIHLLSEPRGCSIEGIVARTRLRHFKQQKTSSVSTTFSHLPCRFIGLSATIDNHEELAQWFQGITLHFDESFRPVPLYYTVLSYPSMPNPFLFDQSLNSHIFSVIQSYAVDSMNVLKPCLIFCATRKSTSTTASAIVQSATLSASVDGSSFLIPSPHLKARLALIAEQCQDATLRSFVKEGIAFHHAGLQYSDRAIVEEAFRHSDILVLCTTSTLALGVNLPAHSVIIKSARLWDQQAKSWIEYSAATIQQSCGRAGRPQFDNEGVAVIMCEHQQTRRYQQLHSSSTRTSSILESSFKTKLLPCLHSEICHKTIENENDALQWLSYTFLFVRMQKNPQHYQISSTASTHLNHHPPLTHEQTLAVARSWIKEALTKLIEAYCVSLHPHTRQLSTLPNGLLLEKFQLHLNTLLLFVQTFPIKASPTELLYFLCQSEDISPLSTFHLGDKAVLNRMLKGGSGNTSKSKLSTNDNLPQQTTLAFKTDGSVIASTSSHRAPSNFHIRLPASHKTLISPCDKAFVLLMAALCHMEIPSHANSFELRQTQSVLLKHALRVAQSMASYAENNQQRLGHLTCRSVLLLVKSIQQKCAPNETKNSSLSHTELRQIKGVGPVVAQLLCEKGWTSLNQLRDVPPGLLNQVRARLDETVKQLPIYEIYAQSQPNATKIQVDTKNPTKLAVQIDCIQSNPHFVPAAGTHMMFVLVSDVHDRISSSSCFILGSGLSRQSISVLDVDPCSTPSLCIDLIDSVFVGLDVMFYFHIPGTGLSRNFDTQIQGGTRFSRRSVVDKENESATPHRPVCAHQAEKCLRSECTHSCCHARLVKLHGEVGRLLDLDEIMAAREKNPSHLQKSRKDPLLPSDELSKASWNPSSNHQAQEDGITFEEWNNPLSSYSPIPLLTQSSNEQIQHDIQKRILHEQDEENHLNNCLRVNSFAAGSIESASAFRQRVRDQRVKPTFSSSPLFLPLMLQKEIQPDMSASPDQASSSSPQDPLLKRAKFSHIQDNTLNGSLLIKPQPIRWVKDKDRDCSKPSTTNYQHPPLFSQRDTPATLTKYPFSLPKSSTLSSIATATTTTTNKTAHSSIATHSRVSLPPPSFNGSFVDTDFIDSAARTLERSPIDKQLPKQGYEPTAYKEESPGLQLFEAFLRRQKMSQQATNSP